MRAAVISHDDPKTGIEAGTVSMVRDSFLESAKVWAGHIQLPIIVSYVHCSVSSDLSTIVPLW